MKYPLLLSVCALSATTALLAKPLPRSTPEEQGISSADILRYVEAADSQLDTMNSFMLLRHGHVVAEGWWGPYAPEHPHILHSLSKSFTSTAVGIAIGEGRLSLDDTVLSFFPEHAPPNPSDFLMSMRVRDLLTMNSGQLADGISQILRREDGQWIRSFLETPVVLKPGTHFHYNTAATYMASAIVQKVTGETVLEYLQPRLFKPLGIENPIWGESPEGVTVGGFGLNLPTEDIARFGQLYLQRGEWNGQQLVPADWVDAATSFQTSNGSNPNSDWEQGYGYQFWMCRPGFYRGDGAHGQFCIVIPESDVVLAITSGERSMQDVMNVAWEYLVPIFKDAPLPEDKKEHEKLKQRLAGLKVKPQAGTASVPLASKVSGRTYLLSPNEDHIESITFDFSQIGSSAVFRVNGEDNEVALGFGEWGKNSRLRSYFTDARASNGTVRGVSGSGAWTDQKTFAAKLTFFETEYYLTYSIRFIGDEIQIQPEYNVAFGDRTRPRIIGRAKDSIK